MALQNGNIVHLEYFVTNAEAAKELIENSGLKVQSAILLSEAAQLVQQAVQG